MEVKMRHATAIILTLLLLTTAVVTGLLLRLSDGTPGAPGPLGLALGQIVLASRSLESGLGLQFSWMITKMLLVNIAMILLILCSEGKAKQRLN